METEAAAAVRDTGVVKWFNKRRGYGFIVSDADGSELFAYFDQVRTLRRRHLSEGQRVSFETVRGPNGTRASRIRILHEDTATAAPVEGRASLRVDIHGRHGWQSVELRLHPEPPSTSSVAADLRTLLQACDDGGAANAVSPAPALRAAASRLAIALMSLDEPSRPPDWAHMAPYLYLRIDEAVDGANVFLVPVARERLWFVPPPLPLDLQTGTAVYVRFDAG